MVPLSWCRQDAVATHAVIGGIPSDDDSGAQMPHPVGAIDPDRVGDAPVDPGDTTQGHLDKGLEPDSVIAGPDIGGQANRVEIPPQGAKDGVFQVRPEGPIRIQQPLLLGSIGALEPIADRDTTTANLSLGE